MYNIIKHDTEIGSPKPFFEVGDILATSSAAYIIVKLNIGLFNIISLRDGNRYFDSCSIEELEEKVENSTSFPKEYKRIRHAEIIIKNIGE